MLAEIGVDPDTPRIEAWNKLDALDDVSRSEVIEDAHAKTGVVAISALTGEGVDDLVAAAAARLTAGHRRFRLTLDPADGAGAAWLHQHGEVLDHWMADDGAHYEVRLAPEDHERFVSRSS